MKANRLWSSWAHLALMAVIALEAASLTLIVIFLIPRFQKLTRDGVIDTAELEQHGIAWMPGFLDGVSDVGGNSTTFILIGAAVVWGLFEWLVRSDNKTLMRLSG